MPRFSPRALPAVPRVKATRTFTDPTFPEPLTLTMSFAPGLASDQYLYDLRQELVETYKSPVGRDVLPDGEPHPVQISEGLCHMIAVLMLGDRPEVSAIMGTPEAAAITLEAPWTFEDWAILAHRSGDVFADIFNWADGLRKEARAKNASSATGGTSSASPSDTDTSTPTS